MEKKYFIAVYTNKVKEYCDDKFFTNLCNLSYTNKEIHVVDNSDDKTYLDALKVKFPSINSFTHVECSKEDKRTLFLRRVEQSVNYLRGEFLKSDCDYFFIIESDVLVPKNVIELFNKSIPSLTDKWGILGGLYYEGFHDYSKIGINPVAHALSGCTIYKRELLEEIPFRWSTDNLGAFSDAWICYDVNKQGKYKIFNDNNIKCEHLHDTTGRRGHQLL